MARMLNFCFGGLAGESPQAWSEVEPPAHRQGDSVVQVRHILVPLRTRPAEGQATVPEGFTHYVVNHSKNFVDPETGTNTQLIENSWLHMKWSLAHKYGTPHDQLDLHLLEHLWRKKHQDDDTFIQLLKEIKETKFLWKW